MLEKMGWSKGKGLGTNENGSAEFVRVRYKNDSKGLGFEARDDQWTQHDDSFNELLQTLNGNEGNGSPGAAALDTEMQTVGFGFKQPAPKKSLKVKISGESLEEKSKRSRARVHYKKFTRGKDLARYSEKDLANIFGKKAFDEELEESVTANGFTTESVANVENSKDNFQSSTLSVDDYFKQKMEALKKRRQQQQAEEQLAEGTAAENGVDVTEEIEDNCKSEKRKRDEVEETVEHLICEAPPKPKKSKKNKKLEEQPEIVALNEKVEQDNEEEIIVKKKKDKKSKKRKDVDTVEEQELIELAKQEEGNADVAVKKKKSKKEKRAQEDEEKEQNNEENGIDKVIEGEKSKKKKEKSKKANDKQEEPLLEENDLPLVEKWKKHKKECNDSEAVEASNTQAELKEKSNKKKHKAEIVNDIPLGIETHEMMENNSTAHNENTKNVGKGQAMKTFEDIAEALKAANVCEISKFAAEKFSFVDFSGFKGSTLAQIPGYSWDENIKLKIVDNKRDEELINGLWSCANNKYAFEARPKNVYQEYVKQVQEARKTATKLPRFKVHQYRRKNVFNIVTI